MKERLKMKMRRDQFQKNKIYYRVKNYKDMKVWKEVREKIQE